jgi:hypothetical protein
MRRRNDCSPTSCSSRTWRTSRIALLRLLVRLWLRGFLSIRCAPGYLFVLGLPKSFSGDSLSGPRGLAGVSISRSFFGRSSKSASWQAAAHSARGSEGLVSSSPAGIEADRRAKRTRRSTMSSISQRPGADVMVSLEKAMSVRPDTPSMKS